MAHIWPRRNPRPRLRSIGLRHATTALLVWTAGCSSSAPVISAESVGVSEATLPALASCPASEIQIDTIASGLDTPWDVAFLPDGSALVGERNGRVSRFSAATIPTVSEWFSADIYSPLQSEIGLMGMDVSPDGDWLYFAATEGVSGNPIARIGRRLVRAFDAEKGHATTLAVFRVRTDDAEPTPERVFGPIPAGLIHGGGALRFSPQGTVVLTNGDGSDLWRAQLTSSTQGKVFEFEPPAVGAGAVTPHDSLVLAYGIRHSQGVSWLQDGTMLLIDHGPSGLPSESGRTDHDELNVVTPGANLGWPIVAGASSGGDLTGPAVDWTRTIAPAGLETYEGAGPWDASIFVTGLRGTRLERIEATPSPAGLLTECREILLQSSYGRLRLVRQAPDGSLWVGTSNRDGRGVPRGNDDLILRLVPLESG